MFLLTLYLTFVFFLSVYSYSLVDPNITFVNHPAWTSFRNVMVDYGYNRRQDSWNTYLILIIILFIFHYLLVIKYKKLILSPFKIALAIGGLLVFSYPFLSADIFSYIFYARITTFYLKTPYTNIPGDFYLDPWLRFTQWTGNYSLYGPVFYLISLIPSFLGFAKLLPTFLLFKLTMVIFYLLGVWFLEKLNKKWAIIFATSPLILIEGLVNGHNDLISVTLVLIGIYYLLHKKNRIVSGVFIILSVGIKYLTLSFLPLVFKIKNNSLLTFLTVFGILIFWNFKSEIQPWYFIMLFGLLPFYENIILNLNIFFLGLLLSYYPFVRFGGWGEVLYWTTDQKVLLKHKIIMIFFLLNISYLLYKKIKRKNLIKKQIT